MAKKTGNYSLFRNIKDASKLLIKFQKEYKRKKTFRGVFRKKLDSCFALLSECTKIAGETPSQPKIFHSLTKVGEGYISLLSNKTDASKKALLKSFSSFPENSFSQILKCHFHYKTGNPKRSLECLRKAAEQEPRWVLESRFWMAIGYVLFELNYNENALTAFNKAISIADENEIEAAFVALVITHMNKIPSVECFDFKEKESKLEMVKRVIQAKFEKDKKILDLIEKGLKKSPGSVFLNALLIDFSFYNNDLEPKQNKMSFAEMAENTTNGKLKSFILYRKARSDHSKKALREAYEGYKNAIKVDKDNMAATIGFCQLCVLFNRNIPLVLNHLELISEKYPFFNLTYKLLGYVYCAKNDIDKAKYYLEMALELDPKDFESNLLLAQVSEDEDFVKAIKLYNRAVEGLKASGKAVPAAIYNNLAVLYHLERLDRQAEMIYKALLDKEKEKGGCKMISGLENPFVIKQISYNYACFLRDTGKFKNALESFAKLESEDPKSVTIQINRVIMELKVKLAKLKREKKDKNWELAEKKKTVGVLVGILEGIEKPEVLHCNVLAKKLEEIGEFSKALVWRKKACSNAGNTTMAHVLLGNALLRSKNSADRKKGFQKHLSKGILEGDKFALNSAGVLLASSALNNRSFDKAKIAFAKAKDSDGSVPQFWMNLGHCCALKNSFSDALTMYKMASECLNEKIKNSDKAERKRRRRFAVSLNMSKAYLGLKQHGEAEEILIKLLEECKNETESNKLRFNLALVKEARGDSKLDEKTCEPNLKNTLTFYSSAKELFKELNLLPENKNTIERHIIYCENQMQSVLDSIKELKSKKEKGLIVAELKKKEFSELKRRKMELLEKEEKMKEKLQKQKNKKAMDAMMRIKEIKEKWTKVEEELKNTKRHKNRKVKVKIKKEENESESEGNSSQSDKKTKVRKRQRDKNELKKSPSKRTRIKNGFESDKNEVEEKELVFGDNGEEELYKTSESEGEKLGKVSKEGTEEKIDPVLEFYERRRGPKKFVSSDEEEAKGVK